MEWLCYLVCYHLIPSVGFQVVLVVDSTSRQGYEGIYETERERERERVSVCGYVFQCWFSFLK